MIRLKSLMSQFYDFLSVMRYVTHELQHWDELGGKERQRNLSQIWKMSDRKENKSWKCDKLIKIQKMLLKKKKSTDQRHGRYLTVGARTDRSHDRSRIPQHRTTSEISRDSDKKHVPSELTTNSSNLWFGTAFSFHFDWKKRVCVGFTCGWRSHLSWHTRGILKSPTALWLHWRRIATRLFCP